MTDLEGVNMSGCCKTCDKAGRTSTTAQIRWHANEAAKANRRAFVALIVAALALVVNIAAQMVAEVIR